MVSAPFWTPAAGEGLQPQAAQDLTGRHTWRSWQRERERVGLWTNAGKGGGKKPDWVCIYIYACLRLSIKPILSLSDGDSLVKHSILENVSL